MPDQRDAILAAVSTTIDSILGSINLTITTDDVPGGSSDLSGSGESWENLTHNETMLKKLQLVLRRVAVLRENIADTQTNSKQKSQNESSPHSVDGNEIVNGNTAANQLGDNSATQHLSKLREHVVHQEKTLQHYKQECDRLRVELLWKQSTIDELESEIEFAKAKTQSSKQQRMSSSGADMGDAIRKQSEHFQRLWKRRERRFSKILRQVCSKYASSLEEITQRTDREQNFIEDQLLQLEQTQSAALLGSQNLADTASKVPWRKQENSTHVVRSKLTQRETRTLPPQKHMGNPLQSAGNLTYPLQLSSGRTKAPTRGRNQQNIAGAHESAEHINFAGVQHTPRRNFQTLEFASPPDDGDFHSAYSAHPTMS